MGKGGGGGEREILLDRAGYIQPPPWPWAPGASAECCMYHYRVVACTMLLGAPTGVTSD